MRQRKQIMKNSISVKKNLLEIVYNFAIWQSHRHHAAHSLHFPSNVIICDDRHR